MLVCGRVNAPLRRTISVENANIDVDYGERARELKLYRRPQSNRSRHFDDIFRLDRKAASAHAGGILIGVRVGGGGDFLPRAPELRSTTLQAFIAVALWGEHAFGARTCLIWKYPSVADAVPGPSCRLIPAAGRHEKFRCCKLLAHCAAVDRSSYVWPDGRKRVMTPGIANNRDLPAAHPSHAALRLRFASHVGAFATQRRKPLRRRR